MLLIGTHQLIAQIFQAFFYINLSHIPELVRTGKMDFLLMLPVDAQFAASVKQFGLDSLVNALVGIAFILTALWKLGASVTAAQVGFTSCASRAAWPCITASCSRSRRAVFGSCAPTALSTATTISSTSAAIPT